MSAEKNNLLNLIRPFEDHHISKLPKPTKAQTDAVKADFKAGIRCKECGGWHHKDVVHLDYVGHAALTFRLLETDLNWNWEPLAFDADGFPKLDNRGGLWIKLTVLGVSRMGYGSAPGKNQSEPDTLKELIGDALRNAAMRFGCALDLWHKGDSLHGDSLELETQTKEIKQKAAKESQEKKAEYFFDSGKYKGKHFLQLSPEEFNQYYKDLDGLIEKNKGVLTLLVLMAQFKKEKGI